MGNCFAARGNQLVHPSDQDIRVDHDEKVECKSFARRKPHMVHPSDQLCDDPASRRPEPSDHRSHSSGDLRIKIRMTAAEFKELVSQVGVGGEGGSDIVRLITQQCLEGTGSALVVDSLACNVGDGGKVRRLESIAEEDPLDV